MKGGKDMKMKMNDVDVMIYVGLLKNIEESVKNGGEGVGGLRLDSMIFELINVYKGSEEV